MHRLSPQTILVISNPTAGRRGAHHLEPALRRLRAGAESVRVLETRRRGDAECLAREAVGVDVVVAAGGDGTIAEVVNGLAHHRTPLGILPLGTVNAYCRELGLPTDPVEAADVILQAPVRQMHLGQVGNRYFLITAGIGFSAQVVHELELGRRTRIGKLAYLATALKVALTVLRCPIEVELDGEILRGFGAIVGKDYGSTQPLPGIEMHEADQPTLNLTLFQRSGPLAVLHYATAMLAGRHPDSDAVVVRKARRFEVRGVGGTNVQADGGLVGQLPLCFGVVEGGLHVVAPATTSVTAPAHRIAS